MRRMSRLRNFSLVYKDNGNRGLLLDRRPALKSLLGDVMLRARTTNSFAPATG